MITLANTFALYQLPFALGTIVIGCISLVTGLTGILLGWHLDEPAENPVAAEGPGQILQVSEMSKLSDEEAISQARPGSRPRRRLTALPTR